MKDKYYRKTIKKELLSLYQQYFEAIISKVDEINWNRALMGGDFDEKKLDQDYEVMFDIVESAYQKNLNGNALQIMVFQYFLADEIARELDTRKWVYRVIDREDTDYFPAPGAIIAKVFTKKQEIEDESKY